MAEVYYVSSDGSDTQNGLSPENAWQSLERVNRGSFKPNDVIRFHRGDTWRGQLIPQSGGETGPVTYGAYGMGEKTFTAWICQRQSTGGLAGRTESYLVNHLLVCNRCREHYI